MRYFPEDVWQVAISFDKTLSWSDQTGRALSAKVENKKIPTSQKNLLTNPLECDTIRMSRGRQERTTSPQCVVGWSKTKSPYRTKKFKKPLDKSLRVWYNKGTGWAGVREQPTSNALRLPQVMVSAHPPPCKVKWRWGRTVLLPQKWLRYKSVAHLETFAIGKCGFNSHHRLKIFSKRYWQTKRLVVQ